MGHQLPPVQSHQPPESTRYQDLLSDFDLTDEAKSELVAALWLLALEIIEARIEVVDKFEKGFLSHAFGGRSAVE